MVNSISSRDKVIIKKNALSFMCEGESVTTRIVASGGHGTSLSDFYKF